MKFDFESFSAEYYSGIGKVDLNSSNYFNFNSPIEMSSVEIDGAPDAKRFRVDTQVSVDAPSGSNSSSIATPIGGEASQEGQSPAAPSSASYRSSNGSVISSDSPSKEEYIETNDLLNEESEGSTIGGANSTNGVLTAATTTSTAGQCDILEMISKTMLSNVFAKVEEGMNRQNLLNSIPSSPSSQQSTIIPGALAVAQTPAAQLFAEDDWSWHRNPAASIRSGGTNKQTPVWKYFVYNKAENLSRCIVGDCTYMLKGPHTSTLACHLKKHTKEYSEFQKLKAEYSRTKLEIQQNQPKEQSPIFQNAQSPQTTSTDSPIKSAKIKKEQNIPKINNMDFLVSAFRSNNNSIQNSSSSPLSTTTTTTATTTTTNTLGSVPALVQNMMLNMNPLQMMLTHSLPTTSTTNGLNALHNAGLSLGVNGQLIQSKKWRKDEKKQRDLQTKLALALSTSHISFDVLRNSFWREMFEAAQPKFNLSINELSSFEHIFTSFSSRLHQSIRTILAGTKKLNILVDAVRLSADLSKITVAVALPSGMGNSYETNVLLLGWKTLQPAENMAEEISKVIEQVLSDYNINNDCINRLVYSGFQTFVDDDCGSIIDKQMESFGSQLFSCLQYWLDNSVHIDLIRKSLFTMICSILANPTTLQIVTKLNGGKFELPITEPFPILIETIIGMRECFQLNQIDGFVGMSDVQWSRLFAIHHICNLFKPLIAYSTDMTTIDTVIPTIQQLKNSLDKDIYQLGEGSHELFDILSQRLAFVTNPYHDDFVPAYIQATALNPQLAVTLNQDQMKTAQCLIEEEILKRKQKKENSTTAKKLAIGVDSILANVMKGSTDSCDSLSIYNDLFQNINKIDKDESKENIVHQYFEELTTTTGVESMFNPMIRTFGNPLQAPLAYWKSCSSKCETLSEFASEILSIPIFTLSSDRVLQFSPNPSPFSSSNFNHILANLENHDQFEKQLILRFNKSLLSKLF